MGKIILLLLLMVFLTFSSFSLTPTSAQTQTSGICSSSTADTARVKDGLVSTPTLAQDLVTSSGICIIDPKAAFAPYKMPTFDDLKSLYYDQLKTSSSIAKEAKAGNKNQNDISFSGSDRVYHIKRTSSNSVDGDLTIEGPITPVGSGGRTGVVFVEGNLNINRDITYREGLVFIVKGNVNIDQDVERIDAVIISEGTICTAYDQTSSACPATNVSGVEQLVVNGSLISLDENKPISFRRSLTDDSQLAAELINHQVKYLVILRNLMSDTFQRWSEISGTEAILTPSPTPTPTPAPAWMACTTESTSCNDFCSKQGKTCQNSCTAFGACGGGVNKGINYIDTQYNVCNASGSCNTSLTSSACGTSTGVNCCCQ